MLHLTFIAFYVWVKKTEACFIFFTISITFILNPPTHFTILVQLSQSTIEITIPDRVCWSLRSHNNPRLFFAFNMF